MRHPSTSWPGLSRPSTRRRCKQRLKLPMASGLGCPAQGDGCPVQQKSPVTRENLGETAPLGGLAGLVPAIPRRMRSIRPHAAPLQETFEVGGFRSAWMPGTSPGKTREGCERLKLYNRSCRTGQPWACPGYPKANAEHSSARRAVARNFRSWRLPHGVDARDKPGQDA
jgi:hypothetical protein